MYFVLFSNVHTNFGWNRKFPKSDAKKMKVNHLFKIFTWLDQINSGQFKFLPLSLFCKIDRVTKFQCLFARNEIFLPFALTVWTQLNRKSFQWTMFSARNPTRWSKQFLNCICRPLVTWPVTELCIYIFLRRKRCICKNISTVTLMSWQELTVANLIIDFGCAFKQKRTENRFFSSKIPLAKQQFLSWLIEN